MLLDVTAFFSTPAIASLVAGALGMSPALPPVTASTIGEALSRPAVVSTATVSAGYVPGADAGTPQPFIGPDPVGGGSSLDTIARLDGVTLLDQLVRLSATERSAFIAAHPDAILGLAQTPPSPASVADWWDRTAPTARAGLVTALPGVVGNLEGLPYAVRDGANRAFLTATVFEIRAEIEQGVGRAMEDELRARLKMLASVEEALRTGESGERRSLVSLDVEGLGRAVIAVGDLADADYVTYFVPGMYVGVSEQLVDWTGNAETSLIEQEKWLDELGLGGSVATVAWIGYQTPTLVNISSLDLAYQGRDALTASIEGLSATHATAPVLAPGTVSGPGASVGAAPSAGTLEPGDGRPFVSIVAHSYGSTAAMLALQENDISVDALVLVGSPGSPATNVDQLKVTDGNVWVAATDSDPIPRSGVFGSQPLDADFGAHHFSVKASVDAITGEKLADITGHVYYFWPGTTSVRNTALIALGQGALVSTDAGLAKSSSR